MIAWTGNYTEAPRFYKRCRLGKSPEYGILKIAVNFRLRKTDGCGTGKFYPFLRSRLRSQMAYNILLQFFFDQLYPSGDSFRSETFVAFVDGESHKFASAFYQGAVRRVSLGLVGTYESTSGAAQIII